ncbi:MAG: hypothetical protein V5A62_02465 [Haloarculaceae archaeon]
MPMHGTPYDFGGAETDGGLADAGSEPDEDTTVIVDGAAMSFRDYRRRGG